MLRPGILSSGTSFGCILALQYPNLPRDKSHRLKYATTQQTESISPEISSTMLGTCTDRLLGGRRGAKAFYVRISLTGWRTTSKTDTARWSRRRARGSLSFTHGKKIQGPLFFLGAHVSDGGGKSVRRPFAGQDRLSVPTAAG
jgi:hypothetical protein